MRLFPRFLFAVLLNLALTFGALAAPRLWVVMSEEGGAYAEVAGTLRAELGQGVEVVSGMPEVLFGDTTRPPDLILTVGVGALDITLYRLGQAGEDWSKVPLLATLVPQGVYDSRMASGPAVRRPMSAVVLDQPLGRQLALIRNALPMVGRVGVLAGPQTRPLLRQLTSEGRARGLKLIAGAEVRKPEEIFPALRAMLEDAEVVLALPDALIYNSSTLQHILLTAYRARVPLVAFSSAYVKAGAVLALYSTPAQVARGAADMVRQWFAGRGLPPPRAPKGFVVSANERVAASLGLRLEDAAALTELILREEAGK